MNLPLLGIRYQLQKVLNSIYGYNMVHDIILTSSVYIVDIEIYNSAQYWIFVQNFLGKLCFYDY